MSALLRRRPRAAAAHRRQVRRRRLHRVRRVILIYVAIMARPAAASTERELAELRRQARAKSRRGRRASPDREPERGRVSELLAIGVSHKTAPGRGPRAPRAARRPGRRVPARPARGGRGPGGGRDLDLQPDRALPGRRRPGRGREHACWRCSPRQAGIRPTELALGDLLPPQLRRRAAPVPGDRRARVDDRRRGRDPGAGQARLRPRARGKETTGPLTNRLFKAALATGKRVRTETAIGERPAEPAGGRGGAGARAARRRSSGREVVIVGTGETSELTARALADSGARHRVRRQPPARPGASASPGATAATASASTSCRRRSLAPTSSSPPPPRRTCCSRRASWPR